MFISIILEHVTSYNEILHSSVNTINMDIHLSRFIVLKYVTSSLRFVFYRIKGAGLF
jgi:hypothetical protein